jgi:hypothetical protein
MQGSSQCLKQSALILATVTQFVPSHPCPINSRSALSSHPQYGPFVHQNPAGKSPSHIQATCPTLLFILNLKTLIIFDEQHKSWSSTFYAASCHFLHILKIPQPIFSSLNVRNQDAHPYKTTGKTRLPYILTFLSHRGQTQMILDWTTAGAP